MNDKARQFAVKLIVSNDSGHELSTADIEQVFDLPGVAVLVEDIREILPREEPPRHVAVSLRDEQGHPGQTITVTLNLPVSFGEVAAIEYATDAVLTNPQDPHPAMVSSTGWFDDLPEEP